MYYYIGVDVSKSTIDVYIPMRDMHLQKENSVKGFKALHSKLKKLYKKDVCNVVWVYEPTSSYAKSLERFCSDQSILCYKINPKASSSFAKAMSQRGKSDPKDAKMLSAAGSLARPEEISIPDIDHTAERMSDLISYYRLLVKQRVQTSNHLEKLQSKDSDAVLLKELQQQIDSFKAKEKELIAQIKTIIANDTKYSQRFENIKSIQGVGDIAAIALLHLFIKYPGANQKQIVSLAGLDPVERSSGTSIRSKTKISKAGSRFYRSALFMSAMVAVRFNDELNRFYQRLLDNKKHTTVAQVAVMKKIIIIAKALYDNNTAYDKEAYLKRYQNNKDRNAA